MSVSGKPVGVICSSGGGALLSALDCLQGTRWQLHVQIVVDRTCGMATVAAQRKLACRQIDYRDRQSFSTAAAEWLGQQGCTHAILFYSRLIAPAAFAEAGMEIHNIHPSLLPGFPGMNSVRKAHRLGVGVLGATLHEVDEGMDTGPMVAQVAVGVSRAASEEYWNHLSYLQKVYLTLVWVERSVFAAELDGVDREFSPLGHAVGVGNIGLVDSQLAENFQQLSRTSRPQL